MTDKSDLFDTPPAPAEESRFTRLLRKVPGLSSYIDKNNRREADQLLRDTVVDRLTQSRLQLSNVHVALSKDIVKAIDHAEPLGRADTRLAGLIGKIEAAPAGYAGWLATHQIGEAELDEIYAFDEQLFDQADLIATGVAALEKAVKHDTDVAMALTELDTIVQNAQTAFAARTELLSGFKSE